MSPLARRLAFSCILILAVGFGLHSLRRADESTLSPTPLTQTASAPLPDLRRTADAEPARIADVESDGTAVATPTIPTADAFADFRAWMTRYLSAPAAERSSTLGEGVALAARRREALAALIPNDPRQALAEAVPMTVRQQLPPEIIANLEERVNARGFFGVLGVVGGGTPIRREVSLADGRRFEAHTFGRRAAQATTENAKLAGISVPNPGAPRRPLLALDERPMRVLESGEIPDPAKPAVETCPVSGKTTTVEREGDGALPPITDATPAVEIEGTIHFLCNGGHIQAVEEELVAAEGATGGAAKPTGPVSSSQSTGVRSLLYMRVAFPESNREPQTETAAYDMMRQVNDWLVENSYGNVYLVSTITPLIVLPYSEAWYKSGSTGGGDEYDVQTDARAVARQMGYDTNQYDLDIVVYTGGPGSFGGLGYVGSKGTWLKSINVGVACHELGHNFGLWHANYWSTTDGTAIGTGSNSEYGNTFDTMGSASAGDLHFNANHRAKINWLPSQSFVTNVTASGTYRIFALDQPRLDPANRYALRFRKDNLREYWAEFRQRSLSSNRWTKDGILLNWAPWTSSNQGAQLLDATPGSPDGKTDAPVVIGTTFSDFGAGIHITPIGKGGTAPESIDVVVNLGTFPGNQPPMLAVAASSTTAAVDKNIDFTATADDPDGDDLAYAWDFGDRTFSNANVGAVSKSWSTAGEYAVRCTVSDMKGQTASKTVIVTVGAPATFRISGQVTAGGQPLRDVRVSNGLSGSSYRGALTDADGRYTIAGLGTGSVMLTATLGGYTFTTPGFANPVTLGPDFTTADFTASETPVVTIVASDPDASETPGDPAQLTITRTGPTTSALAVRVVPPFGGAARTVDYALAPDLTALTPYFAATIPAGQSSLTINLTPIDDTTVEGPEFAIFELAAGTGYLVGTPGRAEITIADNDSTLAIVRLRVTDADATEGGDSAAFLVTRTGDMTNALTVKFSTSGAAISGQDYAPPGLQIVIPSGQPSAPLTIATLQDSLVESTEIVTVTLSTDPAYIRASSAAENSGTINILDDDATTLTVVASDAAASEVGADTGTFIITRSGSTAQPFTVNYALSGSALQGVDYLPLPGTLVIPAGSSIGSVTITPIDDDLGEPTQTVFLQLRSGAGYVAGDASNATINITDGGDLPVVTAGVSDGATSEPADVGKFKFTTTGSGSGNITVRYTVSGSATPDVDYTAISGTLTMGRNTTAEITVTPLDDTDLEDAETVTVVITPDTAYTTHLDQTATINIADDDQPIVHVSATNATFSEASGSGTFYFSRTGSTANSLAVNFALTGTATSGEDFTSPASPITFAAGSSTAILTLAPINDTIAEGTEEIILTLAPGSYGSGIPSATAYLNDNETPPVQVRFASSSGSGSESAGTIEIPVTLSEAAAGEVTVQYVIGGGSATAGVDYNVTSGVLTFAPGETAKTIPLTILEDDFNEPAQSVQIKLQYAFGAALGISTYTYTISDSDPLPTPTLAFTITSASAAESVIATQIIVSLSAAQTTSVSVNVALSGTATAETDYNGGGVLTFAPGETAKFLPVTIVDDAGVEPTETIVLTLNNPTGANLGAATVFTYSIIDDDANAAPVIVLNRPVGATAAIPNDVGLMLDAAVSDDGKPSSPGVVTTTWSRVSGPGAVTFGNTSDAVTTAQFSTPGNYVIQLAASDGELQTTRTLAVIVAGGGTWTGATINGATPAGSFTQNGGTFTVSGGGSNITGSSDQFYFVQQAMSQDFRFTARVVSFTGGNSSAKAGVMFRASTAANSAAGYMSLYGPANTSSANAWRHRATDGASYTTTTTSGAPAYPYWVRITRLGTALSGATSADGVNWSTVGSVTSALPGAGLIGLAVTSNNTAALATATFDNVSITSPTGNVGPLVNAGAAQFITAPMSTTLAGTVSDDGLPAPATITTFWKKISGPGAVIFANAGELQTTASFSELGTYVLRLQADDGWVRTFHDVTVTNVLPVVTVIATEPAAAEANRVPGVFTISRTGNGAGSLVVHYTFSGTATEGTDYEAHLRTAPHGGIAASNGSVTLGEGQTSIELLVTPLADALPEGAETVKLAVNVDAAYTIAVPASATAMIADLPLDGWRLSIFGANAGDPAIAGDDADPDGDGRVNWLEFALGGNPLSGVFEALPEIGMEAPDITLTYRRPSYAPGFIYGVEETLDLALAWGPASFTEETLSDDGVTQLIKARIPAGTGPQKLLRLRVTPP